MKTAEERASETVDSFVACGLDVPAEIHRMIEKEIVRLLKEQDRITRAACAHAAYNSLEYTLGDTYRFKVHAACINVKAI